MIGLADFSKVNDPCPFGRKVRIMQELAEGEFCSLSESLDFRRIYRGRLSKNSRNSIVNIALMDQSDSTIK
jgi:hypothetical protein